MVQSKEQLLQQIKDRFKEDTSDDTIKFIEDISDTLDDYETKVGEDWKTKYEANDKAWRDKYTARFFSPEKESEQDEELEKETKEPDKLTFDKLFKEE